jgi:hypothetical protein
MPHIDTELGLVRTIPREVKMPEGYRVLTLAEGRKIQS